MPNMSLKKNPMPHQPADVRNKNFDEVALGYTEEMAINEAKRCLNCKNPKCMEGCPVRINIPKFIKFVSEGKFLEEQRLRERTLYDLEMLRETGFCHGIENYSRHMSLREEGQTPTTLIDFFS